MSIETVTGVVPRDHVVQLYERADQLIPSVAEFLVDGLGAGDAAIVLATGAHMNAFDAALSDAGIDVAATRSVGSLLSIDADRVLSRILVDGALDADAFTNEIGGLIRSVADSGRRVRIYGELVALLWEAGHVAAAIELEILWNDLGRSVPFALFCSYPAQCFTSDDGAALLGHICDLHCAVVAPSSRTAETTGTLFVARAADARSFPCERYALRSARHFVADTLTGWGHEKFVDDVSLVVGELTTNAVVHARSEYIVAVSSQGDTVRVSVRDASPTLPALQDPPIHSFSGRGVLLVAAIARRWGAEQITGGKVVWAELGVN